MTDGLSLVPTGAKLPVFKTVKESYRFLFENLTATACRFWKLPAALGALFTGIWAVNGSQVWFIELGLLFPIGILLAHAALCWHRFSLLGRQSMLSYFGPTEFDADTQYRIIAERFRMRLIYLVMFVLLPTFIGVVVLQLYVNPVFWPTPEAGFYLLQNGLTALGTVVALSPIQSRLLPQFAARSVGITPITWRNAWNMSKGNTLRLTAINYLASIPVLLVFGLVTYILTPWMTGGVWTLANFAPLLVLNFLWASTVLAAVAVLSGCNAQAFVVMTGWSPHEPEEAITIKPSVIASATGQAPI